MKISLADVNFGRGRQVANTFKWYYGTEQPDVTVFTDRHIGHGIFSSCPKKVAWLTEPRSINPTIYRIIESHFDKFDLVFTFEEQLLKLDNRIRYLPYGTTWIKRPKLYRKFRMVSMIASTKNMSEGHAFRLHIADTFRDQVDLMGHGRPKSIRKKLTGLKRYRYSIAMENSCIDTYFTEKLLDCFCTGTVPIYWGSNKINTIFNKKGIIHFRSKAELDDILKNLSKADYRNRFDAIKENMEIALRYRIPEDFMWEAGLEELVKAK